MATYIPKTLLELWGKGKMSIEMAVGHIIQRLLDHDQRIQKLERQAEQLAHDL